MYFSCFFFFNQKTAYEMRISDWSSDVCSSDLFFALDPNGFAIQSFWPVSETKSILDIYVVGLKSAPSNPEYWVEMRKVMDGIAAEDLRLFEGIQKGVQSVAAPDIIMVFQERTPYWLEEEIDRRIGLEQIGSAHV